MSIAQKKLQRIGNSTGIVLSAEVLRDAGFQLGEEVIIVAERGRVVLTALDPGFDDMVAAADRFVGAHPNALKKLGA